MTTVEPGASEVLTHGLRSRPALDRLLGEQPGADHHRGFEVLVQLVIAAITTRPWSSSISVPSSSVTVDRVVGRALGDGACVAPAGVPRLAALVVVVLGRRVGGREGLRDRLVAAVAELLGGLGVELAAATRGTPASRRPAAIRSCGRFGPAMLRLDARRGRARACSEKVGSSESASWNIPCSRA